MGTAYRFRHAAGAINILAKRAVFPRAPGEQFEKTRWHKVEPSARPTEDRRTVGCTYRIALEVDKARQWRAGKDH